jgi:hypothetical protein
LFLDCATFFVINVVVIFILKANSPLMQVTCSIFQLEISRLVILGATPDLQDYIESGAYIFILATIGSAFLAKWIMQKFHNISPFAVSRRLASSKWPHVINADLSVQQRRKRIRR